MRKLFFPLLLIAAYFIAEEFLNIKASVIVILGLGIAEFAYTRIREKSYDWLILLMTILFCLPNLITLLSGTVFPEFFQTVVIELSLILMLGIPLFSKQGILSVFPASLRSGIKMGSEQKRRFNRLILILICIFFLHIFLTIYSHFHTEENVAKFIDGPLLYILIGIFFIGMVVKNKIMATRVSKEEWLPVIDEQGKVIGRATRKECHSGSKLLHPVVHLHIFNSRKEIFLQKRSMNKDLLPGKWDTAVGGHVGLNEKIEEALKREAFEELGITRFNARYVNNYIWESETEKELVFSFICDDYDRIHIDNDEVDEGRFWSKKEIEEALDKDILTPNFVYEFKKLKTDTA